MIRTEFREGMMSSQPRVGRMRRLEIAAIAASMGLASSGVALGWGRDVSKPDGDYLFHNETAASDLLGRWHLTRIARSGADADKPPAFSLDIVPCGRRYCGIEVGAEGTCGAKVLDFEDRGEKFIETGAEDILERYSGTLDWHDVGKNIVYLDAYQDDPQSGTSNGRPKGDGSTILSISGSTDGSYGRVIPLDMSFAYVGHAACHAPVS